MQKLIFFLVFISGLAVAQVQPGQPLDRKEWFIDRDFGKPSIFRHVIIIAGVTKDHVFNNHEYRSDSVGFGQRLASREGQRLVANATELAFGSLLKEDSRYRPLRTGSIPHRALFATWHAFTAETDSGHTRLAYSRFIAVSSGVLAANSWRPNSKPAGAVTGDIGIAISSKIFDNLYEELFAPSVNRFGAKVGKKAKKILRISKNSETPKAACSARLGGLLFI